MSLWGSALGAVLSEAQVQKMESGVSSQKSLKEACLLDFDWRVSDLKKDDLPTRRLPDHLVMIVGSQ